MSRLHASIVINVFSALAAAGCIQSYHQDPQDPVAVESQALRVRQDRTYGRRWELEWNAAVAYDARTGMLVRRVPITTTAQSGAAGTCRPDLIVSRTGAVFVSSNSEPVLFRIDPSSFEVRRYDITPDAEPEKDFGFSALAWDVEDKVLYARGSTTSTLWRIYLDSGMASKVASAPKAGNVCRSSGSSIATL
jgi:hypothetical protein